MKIGKNEFCSCKSGKKYKNCCMLKEQELTEPNDKEEEDEDEEDDNFDRLKFFITARNILHGHSLKNKPHIKQYKKLRKLYTEITTKMADYFEDGKFEPKIDRNYTFDLSGVNQKQDFLKNNQPSLVETNFDMDTNEGSEALYHMLIYKYAPNINCITEEFIKKCMYRNPEKIVFLQNMLDSSSGLFEVVSVDSKEGYVYLKDVLTSTEHKITDIALSINGNCENIYLYTRIIKCNDISFNSGLNLVFKKDDAFIKKFIETYKKNYSVFGELKRFIELYNYFRDNSEKIIVIRNPN